MTFNLTGTVDEESYDKLCEFLENAEDADVTIRINSGGGNHLDSLAMYSIIRSHRGRVTTVVVGACYSAAVLVFAAGDVREASKEAWFMVHEDSAKLNGSTSILRQESLVLLRQEAQWAQIMAARTGASEEVWDHFSTKTSYLDAEEAKELGLVQHYTKVKND